VKGLTAPREFRLSGTPVASVEALKGLTALVTLNLTGTWVGNTAASAVEPVSVSLRDRRARRGRSNLTECDELAC
jgi:hypothetical protein